MRAEPSEGALGPPQRAPLSLLHVTHSQKVAVSEPGYGLSPDTESASALTSDSAASRTVRKRCLLFTGLPVYGILLKQPRDFPGGTVVKNPPASAGDTG